MSNRHDESIRKWASDNAYSLIFVMILFFLTWGVVALVTVLNDIFA